MSAGRRPRRSRVARQTAFKPAQRPQGVNRRGVQADRIDALVLGQFDEGRHDVLVAALDQQPLGVQPPEHVVALEGGDELLGAGVSPAELARSLRAG